MPTLPYKVGEVVVKFSMNRFSEQSWVDSSTQPWKQRKVRNKRNSGRAILVQTGALRRSVRISNTTSDSVKISSNIPYAAVHNDGFRGSVAIPAHTRSRLEKKQETYTTRAGKQRKRTVQSIAATYQVRAHSRRVNMPRRRFLGESYYQHQQIIRMIEAEIARAFRP